MRKIIFLFLLGAMLISLANAEQESFGFGDSVQITVTRYQNNSEENQTNFSKYFVNLIERVNILPITIYEIFNPQTENQDITSDVTQEQTDSDNQEIKEEKKKNLVLIWGIIILVISLAIMLLIFFW